MPAVFRLMREAYHESLSWTGLDQLLWQLPSAPTAPDLWLWLRQNTRYQAEPNCQDQPQPLQVSLERQRLAGVFGDCEDYTLAISAILKRTGSSPGVWAFLGDNRDNWQHVVNCFTGPGKQLVLIDATEPNGCPWTIPPHLRITDIIHPEE